MAELKSRAIPLAIEAAKQHNALIAIASDRHENGADARDILARDGIDGVRRYIESAQTPQRAQERINELCGARRQLPANAESQPAAPHKPGFSGLFCLQTPTKWLLLHQ